MRVTAARRLDRCPAGTCSSTGCRRSRRARASPSGATCAGSARSRCSRRWWRFEVAGDERLEAEWNALRRQEYEEIVEECETKFEREIEFEIYRGNLTAGEAEEIEADLEKIRAWFGRVSERDVFGAPSRDRAEAAIARCAGLLEDFERRVYEAESEEGPSLQPPAKLPWGETG
jgi:hypothetical protein